MPLSTDFWTPCPGPGMESHLVPREETALFPSQSGRGANGQQTRGFQSQGQLPEKALPGISEVSNPWGTPWDAAGCVHIWVPKLQTRSEGKSRERQLTPTQKS